MSQRTALLLGGAAGVGLGYYAVASLDHLLRQPSFHPAGWAVALAAVYGAVWLLVVAVVARSAILGTSNALGRKRVRGVRGARGALGIAVPLALVWPLLFSASHLPSRYGSAPASPMDLQVAGKVTLAGLSVLLVVLGLRTLLRGLPSPSAGAAAPAMTSSTERHAQAPTNVEE
jgi:hypothetical protein